MGIGERTLKNNKGLQNTVFIAVAIIIAKQIHKKKRT